MKTFKDTKAAKAAIKRAGLHGMNVRYDDVTGQFAGALNIQPVVLCELIEDVHEVRERGFKSEMVKGEGAA